MKKSAIIILAVFVFASCTSKPTLEQRLASKDVSVVKSALTDMWRTGEIQDISSVVDLLYKKELIEDAAIALSLLNSAAVDKIVINRFTGKGDKAGPLLYFMLRYRQEGYSDRIPEIVRNSANAGGWNPQADFINAMILDDFKNGPSLYNRQELETVKKEFALLCGAKKKAEAYSLLEKSGGPFDFWAMNRIKPAGRIKYDFKDRTITSNPYWKKHGKDPVMPGVPGTFKAWHTANPDILVENEMIYFYYRGGDGHDRMAVATSPLETFDGTKFTDYPNNPIINLGTNSFDDLAVLDPGTIFFSNQVFLYYSGLGTGDDAVGLATSKDFYNFKKHKKPVLIGRAPEVLIKDGVIYMYYVKPNGYGGYSIYLATSRDGYNFIQFGTEPVFAPAKAGEWDSRSVTVPRIREKDGIYYMFYAGDDKYMDYPAYFGMAFSYDLVNWYRGTQNPIFSRGKKGDWDDGGIWYAEVFPFKNRLYLYYEGWGGADSHSQEYGVGGRSQIGLATSDFALEDML